MSLRYDEIVALAGEYTEDVVEPLWANGNSRGEKFLKWVERAYGNTWLAARNRANQQVTNLALYKGIYYESQDPYTDFRDVRTRELTDTRKIVVNDVYRYIEALSGKINRFRPSVVVSPHSNEFADREGARVAKRVLETVEITHSLEAVYRRATKRALLFGEQAVFCFWDRGKGAVHPDWVKAKKKFGDKKTTVRSKGEEWEYDPKFPRRVGDFCFKFPFPWEVLFDPKANPEDTDWVMMLEYVHVEQLKVDYPKRKTVLEDLKQDETPSTLDPNTLETVKAADHVLVGRLFHRSNKYMPEGFQATVLPMHKVVLEKGPLEYNGIDVLESSTWGDMPLERITNIDIEGHLHSMASVQLVQNLIHTKNKLLSMVNRNLMLLGHPKFLVHEQAKVSTNQLGNDATIVRWRGQIEPKMVNFATMPAGLGEFYQILSSEADKIMNVHPISSGSPPPGIRAGVALRLLEELEDLQLTNIIKKQNKFVIDLSRKILAYAGKFYEKGDERLVWIVGEDNQDMLETFDPEVLTKPYNLRLEAAAQMARSPGARAQQIIDLLSVKPESLTPEQVIDALDLVRPEKIIDPAQAAIAAAEYVNELTAQNKELPEPREGENFIVKWNVHMAFYQRRHFMNLPEQAQERFRDYMLGLEWLMSEQAQINPAFEQLVLAMPGFPAFFPLPPQQMAKRQALINGQPPQQQPQGQELDAPDRRLQVQERLTPSELTQ